MSTYPKSKSIYEAICAEVENNHMWSANEKGFESSYEYCECGEYEKDAFDNWYEKYIKERNERPGIEDIMKACKKIQMIRDRYLECKKPKYPYLHIIRNDSCA